MGSGAANALWRRFRCAHEARSAASWQGLQRFFLNLLNSRNSSPQSGHGTWVIERNMGTGAMRLARTPV
jgi:hypothetical protein